MSQTEKPRLNQDSIRRAKAKFSTNKLEDRELLSRVVHKIGHEIGNPLTSIISLATIIERLSGSSAESGAIAGDKLIAYAGSIIDEAWRISGITENLVLLLSQRRGVPTSCILNDSLERTLSKLSSRRNLRRALVRICISDDAQPSAYIDADQLVALLCELIGNAAEAVEDSLDSLSKDNLALDGDKAPITVEVSQSNGLTIIEVRSISHVACPLELSTLFEPLVTTYQTQKHVGLGLTAAVAIVERAKGEIEILEKHRGDYYHFTSRVVLPQAATESNEKDDNECHQDGSAPNNTESIEPLIGESSLILPQNLTVFVVEDESNVASAICKILNMAFGEQTSLNCRCFSGIDVIEALKNKESFDAILCDLNLDGVSGRHVLETLLSYAPDKEHRFAFLTGERTRSETQLYLKTSGRLFLHKPFEPDELIRLLVSLLTVSP